MRVLPPMTTHQQRVYCTLALLEEHELKAFFRAIRGVDTIPPQVEIVNLELDRGVQLMDIFGPLGPLVKHMNANWLDLEAIKLPSGIWSITFGFHGKAGYGGTWRMNIGEEGVISDLETGLSWGPREKDRTL